MNKFSAFLALFLLMNFTAVRSEYRTRSKRSLHDAAQDGNVIRIQELIRNGANVNLKNEQGLTPLHTAVLKGNEQVADYLIKNGADVNIQNNDGWTALIEAAFNGRETIVDLLIRNRANVNVTDNISRSALYLAAERGFEKIVESLIRNGADINRKNNDGWSPLLTAAFNGRASIVELLIRNGANVNATDHTNRTPLYMAAEIGNEKIVDTLIKSGADVNRKNNDGWSPLQTAAFNVGDNIVDLLLKAGADVNSTDHLSRSSLYMAAERGFEKVVNLLIKSGADVNRRNNDGWTPLATAAFNGRENAVGLLIKGGAQLDSTDHISRSPVYLAAERGYDKIVELLARTGADINGQNKDGDTPILAASRNGHEPTVAVLVRHNADTNIKNQKKQTPSDVALEKDYPKIAELLVPVRKAAQNACENYSKLPVNRILEGVKAEAKEFPWMAALGYLDQDYKISFDCGGTVISEFFVLTAAHCTKSSRSPVVVRLGTESLTNEDGNRPTNRQIHEIIRHPEYSVKSRMNDISLIKLVRRIWFTDNILPACLQIDLRDVSSDIKVTVSGWGSISAERIERSPELRKTQLSSMPLSDCNRTLLKYNEFVNHAAFRNGISEGQYCAYDPEGRRDSCEGDSGGPLQIFPPGSKLATVVGIVSFGISCGTPLPGIYTRVAYYISWIESHVWPNV